MKTFYLHLADEYLGELAVDRVRGRETYMFRYDPAYLRTDRPLLDPSIRNVTGTGRQLVDREVPVRQGRVGCRQARVRDERPRAKGRSQCP